MCFIHSPVTDAATQYTYTVRRWTSSNRAARFNDRDWHYTLHKRPRTVRRYRAVSSLVVHNAPKYLRVAFIASAELTVHKM